MNIIITIKISFLLILLGGSGFVNRPDNFRNVYPARPGISAVNDTTPDPARPEHRTPAPHNARVKVEIIDLNTENRNLQLQLKIKEVLGYGASTPTLSVGEVLTVNAGTNDMNFKLSKECIKPGKIAVAVISHSPTLEMNTASLSWSITELSEYCQPE